LQIANCRFIAEFEQFEICNLKFAGENVKITNLKQFVVFGIATVILSACSSTGSTTVTPPTRAATQTPWIIYMPVTVTPEPATITPLPTAEVKVPTTPTRTPTRAPVVVKPSATATKPAVAAPPPPTAAPVCNLGSVTLKEPDNGALRQTKEKGVGGDTFRFIWEPPPSLGGDTTSDVGYQLEMESRRGGKVVNGASIYISHNKFLRDGKLYIFDKPGVSALAGGEDAIVTWKVTVIKVSGGFNENDPTFRPAGIIACGPSSPIWTINLKTFE
jgi:hypothetical protein